MFFFICLFLYFLAVRDREMGSLGVLDMGYSFTVCVYVLLYAGSLFFSSS